MKTETVTVATWGTMHDRPIPHNLTEFFAALNEVRLSIPSEYRAAAEIDLEPEYEFGDSYARLRVTYERPMTDEEEEAQRIKDRAHWLDQKDQAFARVAYCERELALLP